MVCPGRLAGMLKERDQWAEELRKQIDRHHPDVKQFLRNPDDDENLVQAIVSTYMSQLMTQSKKRERHTISDDEGEVKQKYSRQDDRRREESPPRSSRATFSQTPKRRTSPRRESKAPFGQTPKRKVRNRSSSVEPATPKADTKLAKLARTIKEDRDNTNKDKDKKRSRSSQVLKRRTEKSSSSKAENTKDFGALGVDWPIEDFNDFIMQATERMQEAQMAAMETKQFRELIDRIPIEVRESYNLPISVASYAIAQTQAKKTIKQIEDMVIDVKEAFKDQTRKGDENLVSKKDEKSSRVTTTAAPDIALNIDGKSTKEDIPIPNSESDEEDQQKTEEESAKHILDAWPSSDIEGKLLELKTWKNKQGTKEGATINKIRVMLSEIPEEAKDFGKITSWEEQVKTKERLKANQTKAILEVLENLFSVLLKHVPKTPENVSVADVESPVEAPNAVLDLTPGREDID